MKKIAILFLVIIPLSSMAQLTFELKGIAMERISSEINLGARVELIGIEENTLGVHKAVFKCNGKQEFYGLNNINKIDFIPTNSKEFWQNQALQHSVYDNIVKNGLQYKLRRELEEEAIEYVNYMENNNLCFEDSYLESYLYALIYRIYPSRLDDGRPGILNVKILKDLSPNAYIFPNGTLCISTGLLSTINSEEELIGVLAHEISHFVLDHSVININEAKDRQKRAKFWATFATGVAAAADIYAATNNEYYEPGAITMSSAILAYSIATLVNERLGIKYSREQEMQADKCAVELMKFIDVDPTALSSTLSKIKNYCILTGDYLSLTGEGTHPALDDRINEIGKPSSFYDIEYDKTISFVNSFNAIVELNNKHLSSCVILANRNIKANVATEEDYVLLAMVTLYMHDTESKNQEALEYINKAKTLNIYPSINISKQEAIVLIRLGKMDAARNSLEKYREGLTKESLNLDKIKNTREWSLLNRYINKEYEWTVKMINKVNKF